MIATMIARPLLLTLLVSLLTFACCGPEPAQQPSAPPTAKTADSPATTPLPDPTANTMSATNETPSNSNSPDKPVSQLSNVPKTELATFGGGCFWCTEAVLEQLDGVLDVQSGYTGGAVDNPTYEQVCGGDTEHAEVVQVTFDPKVISYETLLEWFFRSHNPTTLNRQGADVGTQYRSAIFFHSKQQHETALALIEKIAGNWSDPIVTEITPAVKFWPAEAYHQDYFRNNQNKGYCSVVIKPKLAKLGLDEAPPKK